MKFTRVPDDIDDLIAAWHASGDDEKRELHTYLGMTWPEYVAWGGGYISRDGVIMTPGVCQQITVGPRLTYFDVIDH